MITTKEKKATKYIQYNKGRAEWTIGKMNVTTCSLQCVNKEEAEQRWIKNTLGVFFADRFDETLEILDFSFLFLCWKFDWIHQSLSRTISLLKRVLTYTHGQCYKEKEGFLFCLWGRRGLGDVADINSLDASSRDTPANVCFTQYMAPLPCNGAGRSLSNRQRS